MVFRRSLNNRQRLGLTHFIRIPFATRNPHLQGSYDRLSQDLVAEGVPQAALPALANLYLNLGQLSLQDGQRIGAACKLLQGLERESWCGISGSPAAGKTRSQPFTMDLVGVGDSLAGRSARELSSLMTLYTYIYEPTGTLQEFCNGLKSAFIRQGLMIPNPDDSIQESVLQTTIARTKFLSSGKQNPKYPWVRDLVPRFDARALHERYQDVHWYRVPTSLHPKAYQPKECSFCAKFNYRNNFLIGSIATGAEIFNFQRYASARLIAKVHRGKKASKFG